MMYEKYNANPKGWKGEGDCVVRACCEATGMSWMDTYDELYQIGRKICRMPNSKKTYERFLEKHGWIKQKMPRKWDNTRYTVAEWAEENFSERMVVSVANHLTFIDKNAHLVDTWDCSYKSVGNYWIK
jgi:hypothetical protein